MLKRRTAGEYGPTARQNLAYHIALRPQRQQYMGLETYQCAQRTRRTTRRDLLGLAKDRYL